MILIFKSLNYKCNSSAPQQRNASTWDLNSFAKALPALEERGSTPFINCAENKYEFS
jgi:hypothetical protein